MSIVLIISPLPPAELVKLERLWRDDPEDGFLEALEANDRDYPGTFIEITWQAIHFLLTGTADGGQEPECLLLKGGRELDEWELGAGPNRWLSPDQVVQFAGFLSGVTPQDLKQRWDLPAMVAADIYRADTLNDDDFDFLVEGFEHLRGIVAAAARDKRGLLLYFQ